MFSEQYSVLQRKSPLHYVGFRTSLTRSVKHCRLLDKFFPEEFPLNHKSEEQD